MTDNIDKEKMSVANKHNDAVPIPRSRSVFSLVFVMLIIILGGLGSWKLMDPSTLPIRHVRVEGNFHHLSTVKMQSLVSSVIRGGFFNLNVMSIKEALLKEPWVELVVVKRVWPDGLNVDVKEQTAVGHWNDKDLLNESAHIFTPEIPIRISGLPLLSGPVDTENLVLEHYRGMEKALAQYDTKIQSLNLSERRAWQIKLQDGPLIILGRNDVETRLGRLISSVLVNLSNELNKVAQIDLRYTNGFAVQWRGDYQKPIESGLENNG